MPRVCNRELTEWVSRGSTMPLTREHCPLFSCSLSFAVPQGLSSGYLRLAVLCSQGYFAWVSSAYEAGSFLWCEEGRKIHLGPMWYVRHTMEWARYGAGTSSLRISRLWSRRLWQGSSSRFDLRAGCCCCWCRILLWSCFGGWMIRRLASCADGLDLG